MGKILNLLLFEFSSNFNAIVLQNDTVTVLSPFMFTITYYLTWVYQIGHSTATFILTNLPFQISNCSTNLQFCNSICEIGIGIAQSWQKLSEQL
jgi:hypothetical protein